MSPFVQELISFISLMLGVIVLTAWVMWLLLRPNGDTRVKEFSQESARDGLTMSVIENNELRNKVTRLEREIKVLMAAGYGKKKDDEKKIEDEIVKEKDAGLKTKGEDLKIEKKVEKKVAAAGAVAKSVVANEKVKEATNETPEVALKEEKKEVPRPVVAKASTAVNKQAEIPPVKAEVKAMARKDVSSRSLGQPVQKSAKSAQLASDTEAKRVIDDAEKKKIADYLATVEKTQQRHKKEVEALTAKGEIAEKVKYPNNNLKRIKGIGPHLERKLKKSGITSYQQIAEFSENDIRHVADQIGSFPRRIKREAWVEQAKKLLGTA